MVAEYIIGETQIDIIDESGVPTKPVNHAHYKRAIVVGRFLAGIRGSFLLLLLFYAITRYTVRGEEDLKAAICP